MVSKRTCVEVEAKKNAKNLQGVFNDEGYGNGTRIYFLSLYLARRGRSKNSLASAALDVHDFARYEDHGGASQHETDEMTL